MQFDALPIPITEADGQQQCKNLSDKLFFEVREIDGTRGVSSLFKPHATSKAIALDRRMDSIRCTREERRPWFAL